MSYMQTPAQIAAQSLFVIDPDDKRRNALTCLLAQVHTALPFESLEELGQRWPQSGCIILADENKSLERCREALDVVGASLPIVCYREHPCASHIFAASKSGADGYFAWPATLSAIRTCIEPACARFEAERANHTRQQHARMRLSTLSQRERQVLDLFLDGLCSKATARRLDISARTVDLHRANLTAKMEAPSLLAAAAIALQAGKHLSRDEPRSSATVLGRSRPG